MRNLWRICRLNHASLTCCYNRGRCRPSNPIQNPNYLEPRLIDVKKISCGGSRNHQRRMLANWIDEKSPLENMQQQQQDKQITPTQTHDADSNKPGNNWDMQLLKVPFHDYKILCREQQRLWLAAHFIYKKTVSPNEMYYSDSNSELRSSIYCIEESEDEDEDNRKSNIEIINIVCSDKICIDAKLFERESAEVQAGYKYGFDVIEVESNSEIIKKVELFCAERAIIQDHYANDETLVQHKLNEFNSNFRQENRIHAVNLMIAALDLEIKSLIDVMIEDIDDKFTKMTTDDEAYKILSVYLTEEYPLRKFQYMEKIFWDYGWAFDADSHKPGLQAKENIKWDPELLKVSYYQYKTLPYDQRRQWLTAHFILRRPSNARYVRSLSKEVNL